ncbi:DUF7524 family protein [Halobacterium litoreum]|uniref:Uncharacterized protein n=1 Tax=Halobacterium litoreum TaxID=2039234 RepID=A0ABD5NAU7_9EURY|nr:hypothetical protein [Halobacterium litoreum]UHH14700.1 hypothetical protein LT972_06785 [Halobacterium litoreum]
MPERLAVHLNRDQPREVAPEAARLETDRSFVLAFENHGGPLHVHLHLDDALAKVARPEQTQIYVDEGETRRVEVVIPPDHAPTKGYVDLVTGYGAEEARVNVTVTAERKDGGPDVAVDETLSEKQQVEVESESSAGEVAWPAVGAGVAVVVAAALALAVSDGVAVFVGAFGLLAGVAAAAYVLYA